MLGALTGKDEPVHEEMESTGKGFLPVRQLSCRACAGIPCLTPCSWQRGELANPPDLRDQLLSPGMDSRAPGSLPAECGTRGDSTVGASGSELNLPLPPLPAPAGQPLPETASDKWHC